MMSSFYFWVALVTTPAILLMTWGMYAKFGRGLAMRAYAWIMPVIFVVTWMGIVVGVEQSMRLLMFAVPVALGIILIGVLGFYRSVVRGLGAQVGSISASSAQLSATARQAATGATEQAATVAQVSATIEEITRTSTSAASSAEEVMRSAAEAVKKNQQGLAAVAETRKLLELMGQVGEIVDAVNELTDQSNLLAVNAGIEAAKAGEHGRGFMVVASEVRNLADQSKRATQRIRPVIQRADDGRRTVEGVSELLSEIARILEENADRARHIAATSGQQAAGIKQISSAMATVSESGRNNAEAAKQVEQAVANLNLVAERMRKLMNG